MSIVPLRRLGKNGPTLPAIGFGLMGLSFAYGSAPSDEERYRILDRACEIGETFWDTADLYGDNEELVGKWFQRTGKRDQIFLATKFGYVKGSPTREINTSGEYCKKACAESLKLLGVDSIDLYYMHHADTKHPIEDTMRALVELQSEGKIKHIGLSNISSNTLRRAMKIAPVAAVQVEYSPFVLDVEGPTGTNLMATCRELGVALVASCPLGRGMVTSTFARGEPVGDSKDLRPAAMPRFQDGNREKNTSVMEQFQKLAERKGCTPSQLSLAWLLMQGEDIFPIPGTKNMKYLEENFAALKVRLTPEDQKEVRQFVQSAELAGGFMPPGLEHMIYRDSVAASS